MLGAIAATAGMAAFACGDQRSFVNLGDGVIDGGNVPAFRDPDDGGEGGAPVANVAMCIATTCTYPYATCGAGSRCSTNLSNDPMNCGSCGEECPSDFGYLNLTSRCVDGACEPSCATKLDGFSVLNFADCNKSLEDGCEVLISTDTDNCGGCGVQCAPGVRCIDGKCGCDFGMVDCQGKCIDVQDNDDNCGACGNACQTPDDAGAPPNNMYYGCRDKQCGQLKCISSFGDRWADCDANLANGCEAYIGEWQSKIDPNHCGFCGNKCGPGQLCWDANGDHVPECGCTKANETMCGSFQDLKLRCVDLLNDVENCGTCYKGCKAPKANQIAACRKGVCELDCAPGWGDCDLDPSNGCETDLASTDAHCGACGNRCDTQAGQPCIEGQCAMTECDGGGPK
ncbi:hypothetical protein AKJ09_01627 [Labilithrix luteola]|uniref:Tryptophan synthase alpha chain n=2 Tax=Labilithrix luteola TaxID=1391654 RepID=A0A0K1PN57_9BACT|nr:hypothetical protein AKJ09_01627 [Labilithrix luteola]